MYVRTWQNFASINFMVIVLLIELATYSSTKRKALSVVKAVSYKAHYWICVQVDLAVYTLTRHCVNSF